MKERIIDVILLIVTGVYWLVTGKFLEHFWEMLAPWLWLLCVIIAWHSIKAAYLLTREVDSESESARFTKSTLFSPQGDRLATEIRQPTKRSYRAKIYGMAIGPLFICLLCSYLVFTAAYPKSTIDKQANGPSATESLSSKSANQETPSIASIPANVSTMQARIRSLVVGKTVEISGKAGTPVELKDSAGKTILLTLVELTNTGPPSIAERFKLSIDSDKLHLAKKTPVVMDAGKTLDLSSYATSVSLARIQEDWLYSKAQTPIPTGGHACGFLLFSIPGVNPEAVWTSGKWRLEFQDVFHRSHATTANFRPPKDGKSLIEGGVEPCVKEQLHLEEFRKEVAREPHPVANMNLPLFTWKQEQKLQSDGKPGLLITITATQYIELPAFRATCDRPCDMDDVGWELGQAQAISLLPSDGSPDIIGAIFRVPRQLAPGTTVQWYLKPRGIEAITVKSVVFLVAGKDFPPL